MKQNHNFFSNLAFNLAESNLGKTKKNPSVGCVIVKNNSVISSGVTSINGRPHAERNAIKDSIENVAGSKMYVTLEPCCHKGKTPPCTNLIIKSKISEVIYSISDIDERVSGKSFKVLKSSKIKVGKNLLKNGAATLDPFKKGNEQPQALPKTCQKELSGSGA